MTKVRYDFSDVLVRLIKLSSSNLYPWLEVHVVVRFYRTQNSPTKHLFQPAWYDGFQSSTTQGINA